MSAHGRFEGQLPTKINVSSGSMTATPSRKPNVCKCCATVESGGRDPVATNPAETTPQSARRSRARRRPRSQVSDGALKFAVATIASAELQHVRDGDRVACVGLYVGRTKENPATRAGSATPVDESKITAAALCFSAGSHGILRLPSSSAAYCCSRQTRRCTPCVRYRLRESRFEYRGIGTFLPLC